jgi:predicted lipoprotein with Yx(FWY)xxD motif
MRNHLVFILIAIVVSTLLIAGCTQPQTGVQTPQPTTAIPTPTQATVVQTTAAVPADTVKVSASSLGTIMTDAQGMTLYYFINDVPSGGTSACSGNCSTTWPAFSVDTVAVSSPLLDPADFSSITRADGKKQTTWYGWPLYYFSGDTKPGDVKGDNVIKKWYVLKEPEYTVMIASTPALGAFLTDSSGKTLYFFNKDTTGTSTCTGTCIANWPAFDAGAMVVPSILKVSDFGAVTRADGTKQSSYMGRPLYYFSGDKGPGTTNGQGVLNSWSVANISGIMPAFATPTATTKPPTTVDDSSSGSSGGGGGY